MIKNQWYVVLESKEVRPNRPLGVTRLNEKLVFWRDELGKVHCIKDKCVHRGVSLCTGKVVNGHIACPFHMFEWDGSGKCVNIPANGKHAVISKAFTAKSYAVKEAYGYIWMFYGEAADATDRLPYFEELSTFGHHTVTQHWKAHYSRVIENQLDVVHVPFVHKSTIGRGNKTLVNGPVTTVDEETLTVKVFNTLDEGQPPKKESELKNIEKKSQLMFRFPAIWQNYISEKIRVTIAFVPIDEENTLLYLRFNQNIIKSKVLSYLFCRLGSIMNDKIAKEDQVVVETQLPKVSSNKLGEKLIPGDGPIIKYRHIREKLKSDEPKSI
ncbi:MAG TPA: aromatic ring-hydroxylating dioxygenase subunit alpha [Firmicutes bacterium]|nr:aromatic ring-hydroxylating dioxygenase subunit alpha [Bacillota bacterium]